MVILPDWAAFRAGVLLKKSLAVPVAGCSNIAMSTPLRFDMKLPNGMPLRLDQKGARLDGTVEEVMAALAEEQNQATNMTKKFNRISITVTPETKTQILSHITALEELLGMCISLEDEDRSSIPKLGDKTVGYDQKAYGYMQSHPAYISPLFPLPEYEKDKTAREDFLTWNARLQLLARRSDDTTMLLGSEMVQADNAYMNNAGEAAHRGQAEAEPIYNDLSEANPHRGRAKKAKTPTPTP